MTRVSLTTSASPGRSKLGRSVTWRSSKGRGAGGNDQHARAVARARRTQGDRLGRKLEIKKIDAHL